MKTWRFGFRIFQVIIVCKKLSIVRNPKHLKIHHHHLHHQLHQPDEEQSQVFRQDIIIKLICGSYRRIWTEVTMLNATSRSLLVINIMLELSVLRWRLKEEMEECSWQTKNWHISTNHHLNLLHISIRYFMYYVTKKLDLKIFIWMTTDHDFTIEI